MKNVVYVYIVCAVVMLALGGCMVLGRLARLVDDTDHTLLALHADLDQVAYDLHNTSQNTNAALLQLGLTLDEVRRAAQEQRTYWNQTSQETGRTVRSVRRLVDRTDRNLNDRLLPGADALVATTSANVDRVAADADATLGQLRIAAAALSLQVGDPAIASTVQSIQESAANVALATDNLAVAAYDVRVKVHQATRPASFAVRAGSTALGLGSKIGQILSGFVK